MNWVARRFEGRMHYGWIVIGVVFFVLLAAAGTRATPSVMMLPLEKQFGWSRGTISLAISINLALYGLTGPFAAAAMQRFGVRPTLLVALATLAAGVGLSSMMTSPWQMVVIWGVLVGGATGVAALTLSATVVNRWFTTHRGLAMGILTASSATGQLVFLPVLASISEHFGWRPVVLIVAGAALLVIPLVAWLLPERPADLALRPIGETAEQPPASTASAEKSDQGRVQHARHGEQDARFLAAVLQLLHLRREHERLRRHAPDRDVRRLRHDASAGRDAARGDGHFRLCSARRSPAGSPTASTRACCSSGTTGCAGCR